jgi:hypothetical protein
MDESKNSNLALWQSCQVVVFQGCRKVQLLLNFFLAWFVVLQFIVE